MNFNNFTTICLLVIGAIVVNANYNTAYTDRINSLTFDGHDRENIIKPSLMDDEGEDEVYEDDDDENNMNNYDNYEDENADKRDLIRGPSFIPNIDDDYAGNYLEQENYDLDDNKRKFIEHPKKSNYEDSDDLLDAGKENLQHMFGFNSDSMGTRKDILEGIDKYLHKRKLAASRTERGEISKRLISLLYDWKYTPTVKHTHIHKPNSQQMHDKHRKSSNRHSHKSSKARHVISNLQKAFGTISDIGKSTLEKDVSDAVNERSNAEVGSDKSDKSTISRKKTKGKINVLVNVNINERPARRSKVDRVSIEYPSSTTTKEVDADKKSTFMEQSGALQKLKGEDAENNDLSGSGSVETEDSNAKVESKKNPTNGTEINTFTGLAYPLKNKIKIMEVVDGSEEDGSDKENEEDEEEENEESGSGESEGDDVSTKTEHSKSKDHHKVPAVSVEKIGGVPRKSFKTLTHKLKFNKYHPTHAYEENAEAEKGETSDTVFESKIAADREEKENELEHNDNNSETVTMVKAKETKELRKALEDEVSTNDKSRNTGFSKTLDSETEELSHNVKAGKLKKSKAEDVRIEQVKNKMEPKEIPEDSAMGKSPEQPFSKSGANDKEDEQNDEILFTKKEKEIKEEGLNSKSKSKLSKSMEKDDKEGDDGGDGKDNIKKKNDSDDKYDTLAEVREKFKTWENKIENSSDKGTNSEGMEHIDKSIKKTEDVQSDKKSEKPEKVSAKNAEKESNKPTETQKSDNASNAEDLAKTWKEEEKMLLEKLKNPYLSEKSKMKTDDDDDEDMKNAQQLEKDTSEITKSANAAFSSVVNKVTAGEKEKAHEKDEKDQKEFTASAEKAFSNVVNKITSKKIGDAPEISLSDKQNNKSPKIEKVHVNDIGIGSKNDKNLKQLQSFKEQILSEIKKIDNLQGDYGKGWHSTKDLKEAKDVLQKDLKVVKNLEQNLKKKMALKAAKKIKKVKHTKHTKKKTVSTYSLNDEEIIPDAKLGFDVPKKIKKLVKKVEKKKHPLEEIKSLLKAEIKRLKQKGGKADKQLILIRGLVQQKIKSVIANGDLDKAAFHKLAPDIKELGGLLKERIKNEKKKGHHGKIKGGHLKNKNIDMMKDSTKKPLDSFDTQSKPSGNIGSGIDQQINKVQSELNKVDNVSKTATSSNSNSNPSSQSSSPMDLQQATQHITNAQNVFQKIQKANVTLDPSKSNQMKNLLNTLNQKLGEIYNKAQTSQPGASNQLSQYNQQYGASNNNSAYQPSPSGGNTPPIYIPQTYTGAQTNGQAPQDSYHQTAEGKHTFPVPAVAAAPAEEDFDADENKKALADDEPVNTLVENLERDITEVWSYRDIFPDADSLGLDNEKVHNTYANLGSLSGLSLRRALNRAMRGEDVGLAIVGGSISKGGPFSEKGLDFVLRSYFYAIEDYWNKIIRPVTGSSMIVRDVSIGGISTDYYSYCLQNHLPDDKLTNIVLWELSANDMKRYENEKGPKQQPLEQFTRNILSYKAKPALIYVNFFALFDWDPELSAHCRNYEDEGEDDVARYYKITSLSWRNMVCPLLKAGNEPLFTRANLFAEDNFHPSILAHAQTSYIIIDYIRTEFLKNLVKMRSTSIADAVTRLQIPKSIYVPRPMYAGTYQWKPRCYTYMLVDNRAPNNTLPLDADTTGNFRYTVVREFKIRSDKIVGMETQNKDQYIRYKAHIPAHTGTNEPYKRLGIMTFTDDRFAQVQFDNEPARDIDSKKRFLEGTVIKTIAENVKPGEHTLTVRSGTNGFLICAIVLG